MIDFMTINCIYEGFSLSHARLFRSYTRLSQTLSASHRHLELSRSEQRVWDDSKFPVIINTLVNCFRMRDIS